MGSNEISFSTSSTELKEIAQAANRSNTTRVFDASKINDAKLRKEVFDYAEKLGGGQKLTAVPNNSGRWYIKTADGATINVRSVSSNALPDGSKPRWTIEVIDDKKLQSMINDKASLRNLPREIKFK